ncbi:MAG: DUF6755 family protein [Candidatus Methylomirabilis sp.]
MPIHQHHGHWRITRLYMALAFVIGLLLLQLWLLAGALELALSTEHALLIPVIGMSGLCFLAAWALLRAISHGSSREGFHGEVPTELSPSRLSARSLWTEPRRETTK